MKHAWLLCALVASASAVAEPSADDLLEALCNWSQAISDEKAERLLKENPGTLKAIEKRIRNGQRSQSAIYLLRDYPLEQTAPILALALKSTERFEHHGACLVAARYTNCVAFALLRDAWPLSTSEVTRASMDGRFTNGWYFAINVAEAMARMDCPESRAFLSALDEHPSPTIRWHAADALMKMGEPRAVPLMLNLLASPQEDVNRSSCGNGSESTHERAQEYLQRFTFAASCEEHWHSWIWLREGFSVQEWKAWWSKHKHLRRDDWRNEAYTWASHAVERPGQRLCAFRRLALIGDDQSMLFLRDYLARADVTDAVKSNAVCVLSSAASPAAGMLLRDLMLAHTSATIRAAAVNALRAYRTDETTQAMVAALKDPALTESAMDFIKHAFPMDTSDALWPYLDHAVPAVRGGAAHAIAHSLAPGPIEDAVLSRLPGETDVQAIRDYVFALKQRGSSISIPVLLSFLQHDNSDVRSGAAGAIIGIAELPFHYYEKDDVPDLECREQIEAWWAQQATL